MKSRNSGSRSHLLPVNIRKQSKLLTFALKELVQTNEMREIIISYYLYGKWEFCAALQQELLGTGPCASIRPYQDPYYDYHIPGVYRKSGSWRKIVRRNTPKFK